MNLYKAFSTGLNKRELIKYDENYRAVVEAKILKDLDKDYYESIYLYNDSQYEQFKKSKSLAGISGLKTDRIVFDFDSTNPEEARQDAVQLISRLSETFSEDTIGCYFSGNKGVHVELKLNHFINKKEFSTFVDNYASDLKTFDAKIRDEQRIFRCPMTKNTKSGLFKVPLTASEIIKNNIDQIKEIAKDPQISHDTLINSWKPVDISNKIKELTVPVKTEIPTELDIEVLDKPDMSRKPKHLTEAKYVLFEGFFEETERNEACMILAATCRYLGYNKELAYNMIKGTLRLRARRLNLPDYDRSELWTTVINPVYSPTWKGGTFSEDEGLLKKVIERYSLNKLNVQTHELVSLNSVSDYFKDFALNIDKNTIKLGINEVDKQVRITTGMLVTLLAAPGAGKSSIAMSIVNYVSKNNEKCIFFSLDMSMQQTFQRLIQKHTGQDGDTIFENYKNSKDSETKKYLEILSDEYKNVMFSFRSGLTVENIREMIINENNIRGVLPKLIVVDYLECLHGPFSDPNANKAIIATQLKDIANQFGVCVLLLVQPRLSAGGPAGELNSYTDIKGSSVIGEASAVVMTMSRPGFNPKDSSDDKYATITVVKNRMGQLSSTDLGFDGLTGNVFTLDQQAKVRLKTLRDSLANQESDEEYAGKTSGWKKPSFNKNTGGDLY
jgi:ABC-type dipeptide/oligopeptide/nickel transport system ATPase subunit